MKPVLCAPVSAAVSARVSAAVSTPGPAPAPPPLATASTRSLRAALAVADHGSTAAAARALHGSQSSVVRAVADLEQALGLALFDRSARGMQPTAAGQALLQRLRAAAQALQRADAGPWRQGRGRSRVASQATRRQLQVLLAVAEAGSERSAARQLGISQPGLHQALTQLEHLCGEALFDRLANGLRPTAMGAWVVQAVKLSNAQLRAADEEHAHRQGRHHGRLVVGTLPYSAALVVPQALQQVQQAWPGSQATVVDGTYPSLVAQLQAADLDILVGALRPRGPAGLRQVRLFDDPLVVVVRAGHPLLRRRRLQLRDTHAGPWVLPLAGAPARLALDQAFAHAGLAAPTGFEVNSPTVMQAMLLASDSLALMSRRQLVHELRAGLLQVLPVQVAHPPRPIGYTVRDGFEPPPLLAAFIQALQQARA